MLGFYVYLFAAIMSFINYCFMFINFQFNEDAYIDVNERYIHFMPKENFLNVFNILAIFVAYVFSESFSYMVLMYFVKKASVSKASLFGALHAVFVLILKLIFPNELFPTSDKLFMVIVIFAYIMIFSDKYRAGRLKKTKAEKVIFKRRLSIKSNTGQVVSGSIIRIKNRYFYESQSVTTNLHPMLQRRLTAMDADINRDSKLLEDFSLSLDDDQMEKRKKNNYWILKASAKFADDVEMYDSRASDAYLGERHATDIGLINYSTQRQSLSEFSDKPGRQTHGSLNYSEIYSNKGDSDDEEEKKYQEKK